MVIDDTNADPSLSTNLLANEPAQPGPSVHDPIVSLDSSATPINLFPISDSSTKSSAIQTVQTYLTHQAQMIQSDLTAILPGLIQGEVYIQCAQLAQEISTQISLIQEKAFRPTGDQADLMLPFCEENENAGSRGHGKQFAKHSYNQKKRKEVKFATESNSKGDEPDDNKADDVDEDCYDSPHTVDITNRFGDVFPFSLARFIGHFIPCFIYLFHTLFHLQHTSI
jgi:hypothetical protein